MMRTHIPKLAAINLRVTLLLILIGIGTLGTAFACQMELLPSTALHVDFQVSNSSAQDIASQIDELLAHRGFEIEAKDGYDLITGKDSVRDYTRDTLIVSVGLHHPTGVHVRVSERSKSLGADALQLVEDLASAIDAIYPGAVSRIE